MNSTASNISRETWNSSLSNRKVPKFDVGFHSTLIIIALFIIFANGLVLLVFKSARLCRRRSNYFLMSLAISDMTTGLVAIPLNIYCESTILWNVCLLSYTTNRFIGISTINHILLLTTEKYLAVMHPLRHRSLLTKKNVTIAIATTWLLSLLIALIPLQWLLSLGHVQNRFTKSQEKKQTIHETFVFTVFFVLPLIIMFACYARLLSIIVSHSWYHRDSLVAEQTTDSTTTQQLGISRNRRFKPMLLVLALLITFILSWSWWYFGTIQRANRKKIPAISPLARSILIIVRFSSSFLNPLLYTFIKQDVKAALKRFRIRCFATPTAQVARIDMQIPPRGQDQMEKRMFPKIHNRNNKIAPSSNRTLKRATQMKSSPAN